MFGFADAGAGRDGLALGLLAGAVWVVAAGLSYRADGGSSLPWRRVAAACLAGSAAGSAWGVVVALATGDREALGGAWLVSGVLLLGVGAGALLRRGGGRRPPPPASP